MRLWELRPAPGARRSSKRVGRGVGSGRDKTCGRGTKGQKSRSGRKPRVGFEGGQMPLQRRLPKRGFTSLKKRRYTPVNIEVLNRFEQNTEISKELLYKSGLIKRNEYPKLLGRGDLKIPLTIKGCQMSKTAREKVESSGGRIL